MDAPSIQDLWNLPVTPPAGYANPQLWPALAAMAQPAAAVASSSIGGQVKAWVTENQTAVIAIAGALFVLALFGGGRRR